MRAVSLPADFNQNATYSADMPEVAWRKAWEKSTPSGRSGTHFSDFIKGKLRRTKPQADAWSVEAREKLPAFECHATRMMN
jgi:hypothetical protein